MSVDLRLGGLVVEAADALGHELCGTADSTEVVHVPEKGKNGERFLINIGVGYLVPPDGGDESKNIVIDVPVEVAPKWAETIKSLCAKPRNSIADLAKVAGDVGVSRVG